MIIQGENVLLFIEPKKTKSQECLKDELTIKMFNLLQKNILNTGHLSSSGKFIKGLSTMGVHTCKCGAASSSVDYIIDDMIVTNFLCVHYLAYHRDEVPKDDIDIIHKLVEKVTIADGDEKKFQFSL